MNEAWMAEKDARDAVRADLLARFGPATINASVSKRFIRVGYKSREAAEESARVNSGPLYNHRTTVECNDGEWFCVVSVPSFREEVPA